MDRAWAEARSDADIEGIDIRLYSYDQRPRANIPLAALFLPGKTPSHQELEPLDHSDRREILRHPKLHRITLFTGIDSEVLAPKLRHELEHVRQWENLGSRAEAVFDLAFLVHECQYARYDLLPASAQMYNLVPIEQDANGAAAQFSRSRYGARADELARTTEEGVLFRAQPQPEPFDTLATRLVCIAAIYGDEFERQLAAEGQDRDAFLRAAHPSAADLWSKLRSDSDLSNLVHEIRRSRPRRNDLQSLEDPGEGWGPVKQETLAAVDRARTIAGIGPRPVI